MEVVDLRNPNKVVEVRYKIKHDVVGYCELHGNPMTVQYLEAYGDELWVGDCGCSSNHVKDGYEIITTEYMR